MDFNFKWLVVVVLSVVVRTQSDWADPDDRIDYPNFDIGHYPLVKGKGNCHKCLSLSKKSMYAIEDPDCRMVPFENAPRG